MQRAVATLSERYRGDRTGAPAMVVSDLEAAAYVAYRMPATYAAVLDVLCRVQACLPDWQPATLFDVGAGTGAGLWAATHCWPGLDQAVLLDACEPMIALGQKLARNADRKAVRAAEWRRGDLRAINAAPTSDLVLVSYTLNELPPAELGQVVDRLWKAAQGIFVLVEPGTPAGFGTVREARRLLLERGARIIAPCPHDDQCPMPQDDWCHFSVRLPRGRLHRAVKPGELGYEDEKFSYIVASKLPAARAGGRVLRHPTYRKGMVRLTVCGQDGISVETVTRKSGKARYRAARDAAWGDEFPDERP